MKPTLNLRNVQVAMVYTDQPKKKAVFAFRRGTPLARKKNFHGEKLEITYFAQRFLCEIPQRNSVRFRGDTPRNFSMGS